MVSDLYFSGVRASENSGAASMSLRQQADALRAGKRSLTDELAHLKARAAETAGLRPLAWVDWERAGREAQALTDQIGREPDRAAQWPLLGAWISVKDLFQLEGAPMKAGTEAALPPMPAASSTVVQRLQAAGALVFAKTNMHEIALGATGENPWTGDVCNPHDPARQSGGSSSGSGVAVAVGLGSASIGSDTGGSIRIPSAFCGVVGFKPTVGSVSLAGVLPLSWTCDHAGPLARSVQDAALLHQVLSGRSLAHGRVARRPRLGVPRRWLAARLDAGTHAHFEALLALLATQADLVDAEPHDMGLPWRHYTPIVRAEAARVHHAALAEGGQGFSAGVLTPLQAGAALSAQDYIAALQARSAYMAELDAVLAGVDALVLPTSAIVTPLRGQDDAPTRHGRLMVREAVLGQTLPFSFAGVPAISLPAGHIWLEKGHSPKDGPAQGQGGPVAMPFGLQLVGGRGADASLLALAAWVEAQLAQAPTVETRR